MTRRPSRQTVAVLHALAEDPTVWRYGYELCLQVGTKAGTLYPILIRLADRDLLEHTWEDDPPAGRPPRHLYRLTAPGLRFAAEQPKPAADRSAPARSAPAPARQAAPAAGLRTLGGAG